jgi:hypothetical protein
MKWLAFCIYHISVFIGIITTIVTADLTEKTCTGSVLALCALCVFHCIIYLCSSMAIIHIMVTMNDTYKCVYNITYLMNAAIQVIALYTFYTMPNTCAEYLKEEIFTLYILIWWETIYAYICSIVLVVMTTVCVVTCVKLECDELLPK